MDLSHDYHSPYRKVSKYIHQAVHRVFSLRKSLPFASKEWVKGQGYDILAGFFSGTMSLQEPIGLV